MKLSNWVMSMRLVLFYFDFFTSRKLILIKQRIWIKLDWRLSRSWNPIWRVTLENLWTSNVYLETTRIRRPWQTLIKIYKISLLLENSLSLMKMGELQILKSDSTNRIFRPRQPSVKFYSNSLFSQNKSPQSEKNWNKIVR
jgi:hypothetical protein